MAQPLWAAPVFRNEHTVSTTFAGAVSVRAADIDHDGDLDIVGAGANAGTVAWWENTSSDGATWTYHAIDAAFAGASSVHVGDIDGDGAVDVLATAFTDGAVTWWRNAAGDGSSWTKTSVDASFTGAEAVYAADIDGDGHLDIVGAASTARDITWWENANGDGLTWTKHLIEGNLNGATSVHATDIDRDGDLDVLGCATIAHDVTWWENTNGTGLSWSEHSIDGSINGANSVFGADLDGDADIDVIGSAYNSDEVLWWENNGSQSYTRHIIDSSFNGVVYVTGVDLDADGDMDILGAAAVGNLISWWENTAGDASSWTRHDIDAAFTDAACAAAGDMNGDGSIDVLGSGDTANTIAWWEQNRAPAAPTGLGPAGYVDGSVSTDATPTLEFTQDDPNDDNLSYRIQIDDTSDFSSPVIDYTSGLLAEGATSFTVGQAAGTGSYTVGSAGQMLGVEGYYWRVCSDDGDIISDWTTANSGGIAFIIPPAVDFSTATLSANEGDGTASVTVTLNGPSSVTITVDCESSNGTATAGLDYTAVSTTVQFNPGVTSQSFNVTLLEDDIDEDGETLTLTLTQPTNVVLAGTNNPATLTISDNDTAGITLTESSGTTDISEAGSTDDYTLVLQTEPTADVVITLTPDAQADLGAGPGSAVQRTFTSANWDTPQSVTVSAFDDAIDEGAHTATISHTVAGSDAKYNGLSVGNVSANITDNDTAGVTITQSGGTTAVIENGATDTYTLVLDTQPTASVTVTLDPDGQTDLGSGAGAAVQRVFTTANWMTPQLVTVTAYNDMVHEGAHASTITHSAASTDGNYDGIAIANINAAVYDDDVAGITLNQSGGTTNVTEGGATDSYTLVLDSQPTAGVTITVTPDSQTDLGNGGGNAVQKFFTTVNWNSPQTISVTAVDDVIQEAATHLSTITHAAVSMDADYGGLPISDISVNITDNDTAGVAITESGGSTDVTEGGAGDSYTIVLQTQPTATITVSADPDLQTDLGAGPGTAVQLVFTTSNWSTPQTVNVTATDDAEDEGAHTSQITHTASGGDPAYHGVAINSVTVSITDDDQAGVTISETGGTTEVAEGGATDTYTLVLDSRPSDTVTITVSPDTQTDLGAGGGTAVTRTFTTENWDTPQDVTVRAVDDGIYEGAHASTITHSAASTDGNYNGVSINNVAVSISDNDSPGITVTESGSSTDITEGGATDTFTIVLNSQPTADVVVFVTPDAQANVGSGPGNVIQRTFSSANWASPQTITVSAYDDTLAEGAHTSTISFATASADAQYDGISLSDITASITDNDVAGVTISQSAGSTTVSEAGTTDTYTVVLNSRPTNTVTITIDPDSQTDVGAGAGAATQLTFTTANWMLARLVTVTAIDDAAEKGTHSSTITHTVSSADGDYNGLAVGDVVVTITDNDAPAGNTSPATGSVLFQEPTGGAIAEEGGTGSTYSVSLSVQPTDDVVVIVRPDAQVDVGAGASKAISLVFTAGQWNIPQRVTVVAVDDNAVEGTHTSTIQHATNTTDARFLSTVPSVAVRILDNDYPPSAGSLVTAPDSTRQASIATNGAQMTLDASGSETSTITLRTASAQGPTATLLAQLYSGPHSTDAGIPDRISVPLTLAVQTLGVAPEDTTLCLIELRIPRADLPASGIAEPQDGRLYRFSVSSWLPAGDNFLGASLPSANALPGQSGYYEDSTDATITYWLVEKLSVFDRSNTDLLSAEYTVGRSSDPLVDRQDLRGILSLFFGVPLCGFGITSCIPLIFLGLLGMRSRPRSHRS